MRTVWRTRKHYRQRQSRRPEGVTRYPPVRPAWLERRARRQPPPSMLGLDVQQYQTSCPGNTTNRQQEEIMKSNNQSVQRHKQGSNQLQSKYKISTDPQWIEKTNRLLHVRNDVMMLRNDGTPSCAGPGRHRARPAASLTLSCRRRAGPLASTDSDPHTPRTRPRQPNIQKTLKICKHDR